MGRGRKPVPTKLRLLRGNPGHRPLNENEPEPEIEIPPCPEHLNAVARAEWERIAPELAILGLISHVDRAALAVYCSEWARYVKLEAAVEKYGEIIPVKGALKTNPQLIALKSTLRSLLSYASEFGMTPASRSRLRLDPPQEEADPFDAILNRVNQASGA